MKASDSSSSSKTQSKKKTKSKAAVTQQDNITFQAPTKKPSKSKTPAEILERKLGIDMDRTGGKDPEPLILQSTLRNRKGSDKKPAPKDEQDDKKPSSRRDQDFHKGG